CPDRPAHSLRQCYRQSHHRRSPSLHDALPISLTVIRRLEVHFQGSRAEAWSRHVKMPAPLDLPERPIHPDDPTLSRGPARQCRRSEEHTSELQSRSDLVCRLLLEKKKLDTGNF